MAMKDTRTTLFGRGAQRLDGSNLGRISSGVRLLRRFWMAIRGLRTDIFLRGIWLGQVCREKAGKGGIVGLKFSWLRVRWR